MKRNILFLAACCIINLNHNIYSAMAGIKAYDTHVDGVMKIAASYDSNTAEQLLELSVEGATGTVG